MQTRRWIVALVLCFFFAAAAWFAVASVSAAHRERSALRGLTAELRRVRAERRRWEHSLRQARQAGELLERARRLGLEPAQWMLSSFAIDSARDAEARFSEDPVLKRLSLEKERIEKERDDMVARLVASGKTVGKHADEKIRAVSDKAAALQQRVAERVRMRERWIEAHSRYNGAAVLSLVNDLSDATQGAWFAPELFEVLRVSWDQYEVLAKGTFLTRREGIP